MKIHFCPPYQGGCPEDRGISCVFWSKILHYFVFTLPFWHGPEWNEWRTWKNLRLKISQYNTQDSSFHYVSFRMTNYCHFEGNCDWDLSRSAWNSLYTTLFPLFKGGLPSWAGWSWKPGDFHLWISPYSRNDTTQNKKSKFFLLKNRESFHSLYSILVINF